MLAIVTDTSAGLTREEAMQLGVRVVPMSYSIAGRMFLENPCGQNGDYAALLAKNVPATTAQATVIAFMNTFEELLRMGFQILCLTISSRLSGTYSSAVSAAKELDGKNIAVVDSQLTSRGLAFLVAKARQLENEGYGLQETALMLGDLRDSIGIAFSVENMDALRRSGRLGVIRQSIGTILNLRPVLRLTEGAIVAQGQVRGRIEQRRALLAQVPKQVKELVVLSFGGSEAGEALLRQAGETFPKLKVTLRDAGPVLAIHLGVGTVGLAWVAR